MLQLDQSSNTVHQFFITRCPSTSAQILREYKRERYRSLTQVKLTMLICANIFGLTIPYSRRQRLCDNQFETVSVPWHKLFSLLPPKHRPNLNLRRYYEHDLPQIHTDRFKNSFIPAMCAKKFLKSYLNSNIF